MSSCRNPESRVSCLGAASCLELADWLDAESESDPMALLRLVLLFGFLASQVWGQGTVNFMTRVSGMGVDMPVFLGAEGGLRPGPEYVAALYIVEPDGLKLIDESITEFSGGDLNPARASYIQGQRILVPGYDRGQSVVLRIRAWHAADWRYEFAPEGARGESEDLYVSSLGGCLAAFLPSSVSGFVIGPGFEFNGSRNGIGGYPVLVAEPSTFSFWIAGGSVLLGAMIRRRKAQQRSSQMSH